MDDLQKIAKAQELLKESVIDLQELGRAILTSVKPKPGPYALFHHQAHAIERCQDLSLLAANFAQTRTQLLHRDVAHDPAEANSASALRHELTHALKLQFETTYVFGVVLLDQITFVCAYCFGHRKANKLTFSALTTELSEGDSGHRLEALWDKFGKDMIWLFANITLYRNTFINHADRPWQRGITTSVRFPDCQLFTPSPPGWADESKISVEAQSLIQSIVAAHPTLLPGHPALATPMEIIERLLRMIDNVDSYDQRSEIMRLARKIGFSTPTYGTLILRLAAFVRNAAGLTMTHVENSPAEVLLGPGASVRSNA